MVHLSEEGLRQLMREQPATARGYLACEAAALLEEAGFRRVYTVLGGFADIRQARFG